MKDKKKKKKKEKKKKKKKKQHNKVVKIFILSNSLNTLACLVSFQQVTFKKNVLFFIGKSVLGFHAICMNQNHFPWK